MILADKIIEERKKLGLSQEELAEKLSVSRQSVSKWESAQSIPDLQKIIMMSDLFSVSTDYLLKDGAGREKVESNGDEPERTVRRVSMEEANAYLGTVKENSRAISLGVLLCILCPVLLIFLAGLSDAGIGGISETLATAGGLAALFPMVAVGVFLFVRSGLRGDRFGYLEKEEIETAYGVTGLAKEKKAAYAPTYIRYLSLGVVLCVLSPLPLVLAALINGSDVLATSMTALLLCIVAVGVYMIVRVAIVYGSYQVLLQEGDYDKREKARSKAIDAVSGIYWTLAVAIYLAWSFLSGAWNTTWILWPIAGVLFAPVSMIVGLFDKNEK